MRNYISESNKRGGNHVLLFVLAAAFLLAIFTGSSLKAQEQKLLGAVADDYSSVNHRRVLQKRSNRAVRLQDYDEVLKDNEQYFQLLRDHPNDKGIYPRYFVEIIDEQYDKEDQGKYICVVNSNVDLESRRQQQQQQQIQRVREQKLQQLQERIQKLQQLQERIQKLRQRLEQQLYQPEGLALKPERATSTARNSATGI